MTIFREAVESLAMQPGVRGAVIAAADGVVIDGVVHVDVRADALAAFGTAVLAAANSVRTGMQRSQLRCIAVDAEHGRLCLAGSNELAIIVLADRRTPIGRLRLALRHALESLS